MYIHKSVLSMVVAAGCLGSHGISSGQSSFTVSTFCVHTNGHVFLTGKGFPSGSQIQGFLLSSHYRSPLWSFTTDTTGEFNLDVTWTENLDMGASRAVQEYQFSGGGTNITFHVWYQTNNATNDWHSTITNFDTHQISSSEQQVDVVADITAHNNYQVQMATNLSGPWIFVGDVTKSENPVSSFRFGFQIPRQSRGYFRIADPYRPCPCDF